MRFRAFAASAAFACAFTLLTGCADFEHLNNSPFQDAFQGALGGGKKPPADPQQPPPNQDQQGPDDRKPGPCVDLDPAVIATCIKITGGIAPIPGADAALVAERSTGNILLAKRGPSQKAALLTHVDVNAAGDGGLMDLALSPNFATDGAIFAYISTGSDNRVVRLTKESGAKDVLTGIPHTADGNYGSIQFGPGGALYVLTSSAGDEAAAQDPGSLAGKILRIEPDQLGGDGNAATKVIVSGLGSGGALCFDVDDPDSTLWYTNRSPVKDELLRIPKGASSPQLVWSWPERPGVSGCAVKKMVAFVAAHDKLFTLAMPTGASGLPAEPVVAVDGKYGVLGDVAASAAGMLCFGTVNQAPGGRPDENVDDRVVCSAGGGGGGKGGVPGFGEPPKPKDD
ncbi:MAG: PQQ-dependent sugar dehydrogenase [Segniliparus sp.]|uniref:PQQ-dependent sugar dehydrogenase n=1 Tax=Segniliparus sp. TaxID=2804064 RepID=UPI003F3DBA51